MKNTIISNTIKSFMSGASRVLDLGAAFNSHKQSVDADYEAIKKDWYMVGVDIDTAINKITSSEENNKNL